jgi:membrane protein DedA with SNARE-associated domain
MTDLPGVFGTVAPYIEDYGLLAVAVLVFIENLGIPMPGEATLVMAGIFTVSGDLNLFAVLAVGWIAAVLGDNAGFAIGRYGGRPLVLRLGRRFGLTHEALDRVEGYYERHGAKTVAAGRFVPVLRHLNGLVAGVTTMTWRRFLLANAVGAVVWVGAWTTAGIKAGDHIEAVNTVLERGLPAIVVLLVVLLVVRAVRLRRRRVTAMAEPLDDDHEEEHG